MAALSADASRKTRNRGNVKFASYAVGTSATVYKGGLCSINTSTGRLVAGTAATGRKFVGLCTEKKTGNAGGTVYARVEWNIETLVDAATALTKAYIGSNCAISNDNQVTTLSGAGTTAVRVRVGEVVQIESGDAWVALRNFAEADV